MQQRIFKIPLGSLDLKITYDLWENTTCTKKKCWASWHMLIISALKRLRQKNCKLEAIVGYIVRPCL
jgi:hypothetical protein